jgi:integrase
MLDQSTPSPQCATLQHVLDALTEMFAAGEISERLLRDARSAILSYCRAVKKEPKKLKADIVELLDRLDESTALKEGLFEERFSNIKSLLRRALNLAGNPTKAARRDRPLSSAWQRRLDECGDKEVQARLRPFAGFCTDHGIEPPDVVEATFVSYEKEVRTIAKSRNPNDALKKVRRCWNKLVDQYPSELRYRSPVKIAQKRKATVIDVMPKSFQKEMALLHEARSPETYEKHFLCRPLKHAKAVDDFCAMIMRIVTAAQMAGHSLSEIKSLRYLVEPTRFDDIMRQLKGLTGAKELRQLGSYVSVIHWLAEVWVRLSAAKMRSLKLSMAVVGRRRAEISDSSLEVLEQVDDPRKRQAIKVLAETLEARFMAKGADVTRDDAQDLRDALYWELGLTTGWRPSSRARINMDEDITWSGGRPCKGIATVRANKKSEKTELRRVVELPKSTSRILALFIKRGVPLLTLEQDPENPHLFPGRKPGQHMTTSQLSTQSEDLIARRTGFVGATGHKSRHVSVKMHLIHNPGDWVTVQEHVGHRDPVITQRFYAQLTQTEASKRVQKSMGKR